MSATLIPNLVPHESLPTPAPPEPAPVQGLSAPPTTPTPPDWEAVDVSTIEWDGSNATLHAPGREVVTVPVALANYITAAKKVAAVQAGEGLNLTGFVDNLRAATKDERASRDHTREWIATVKAAGASEQQLEGMYRSEQMDALVRNKSFSEKVAKVRDTALESLANAERQTIEALRNVAPQPTEQDYAAATDLSTTLDLLPASIGVPLLRGRLVESPAKYGKNLGLVAAVLPLLRAKIERDPSWNTIEARQLLVQAELVTRSGAWYKSHMRLARIHQLQYKVQAVARAYDAAHGDEQSGTWSTAIAGGRDWLGDVGVGR